MNELERAWLAGLWEGEGSFRLSRSKYKVKSGETKHSACYRAEITMTDEDIVQRVATLTGKNVYNNSWTEKAGYKKSYRVILHSDEALSLMLCLFPYMGERRQQSILDALEEKSNAKARD